MKKKFKKFIKNGLILLLAFAFLFTQFMPATVSFVSAEEIRIFGDNSTIEQTNNQTGGNSENTNVADLETTTEVETENDSTINNGVDLELNSGDNTIDHNTIVDDITTGDIEGAVNIINMGNTDLSGISLGTETLDGNNLGDLNLDEIGNRTIISTNEDTGSNSENTNIVDQNNIVSIISDNDSVTNNDIQIEANTGGNEIGQNTVVGDVTTGDINLAINLLNLQNFIAPEMLLYLDLYTIWGDWDGNIVIPANKMTGQNSSNQNLVNTLNNLRYNLDNQALANNGIDILANTGENQIGQNTMIGDVTTGATDISTNLINWANSTEIPVFYIINVFGEWFNEAASNFFGTNYVINQSGQAPIYGFANDPSNFNVEANNSGTGQRSDNLNSIDSESNTDIEINNDAEINNNLDLNLNTGKNIFDRNTVIGNISTGAITAYANVINILNTISSGAGKFRICFLNIFGNWRGCLVNEETEEPYNPPTEPEEPYNPPTEPGEPVVEPAVDQEIVQRPSRAVLAAQEFVEPEITNNLVAPSAVSGPEDNKYLIISSILFLCYLGIEQLIKRRKGIK